MLQCSFFSYKGGSGRSSLLYNTMPFLANELGATNTEPIVVVDLDLDSMGLSYLLHDKAFEAKFNAINVLRHDSNTGLDSAEDDIGKHPFFVGLEPIGSMVGLPGELDKSILLLTAHSTGPDNKYMGDSNYDAKRINLDDLCKTCRIMKCKAVLFDLPAGEQLSGKKGLEQSNKIVTVMRITKQFREGTYEFLKERSLTTLENKEFLIVPNAVPNIKGTPYNEDYIEKIITEIASRTKESLTNDKGHNCNLTMCSSEQQGINEVQRFKFEELNLFKEQKEGCELSQDEVKAMDSYKKFAKELAK